MDMTWSDRSNEEPMQDWEGVAPREPGGSMEGMGQASSSWALPVAVLHSVSQKYTSLM